MKYNTIHNNIIITLVIMSKPLPDQFMIYPPTPERWDGVEGVYDQTDYTLTTIYDSDKNQIECLIVKIVYSDNTNSTKLLCKLPQHDYFIAPYSPLVAQDYVVLEDERFIVTCGFNKYIVFPCVIRTKENSVICLLNSTQI